ncbi:MAG: nucleoside deaminase [Clostridiales bacterium]|nr:nucleoside deaminase [Candidatus Apopatousia equi]
MEEKFMILALEMAQKASKKGEVPVGAVIVKDGKVISKAYNKKEHKKMTTRHAEIEAIEKASKKLKDWRLNDCEMYVSLEPCCMCAGAILNSRLKKVYIGAMEKNFGCVGSAYNLLKSDKFTTKVEVETGVMEEESVKLLQDFFKSKR